MAVCPAQFGRGAGRGAKQIPAHGWPPVLPSAALTVGRTGGRRGRRASKNAPGGRAAKSAPAVHSCGSGGSSSTADTQRRHTITA